MEQGTGTSPTPELQPQALRELRALAGTGDLLTDPADCWPYGYDSSRRQVPPLAVVLVTAPEQVAGVVSFCNRLHIPVTARGRGTGTTGASVPERRGIVLSFERMGRILRIDPTNRLAVVEPGVTNEALQQAIGELGFFWPPDPSSAPVCTIGGNLACNAAGPRAIKYATPRENTLGLAAVTGAGESIRTGVLTTKGVVGYDLTRLIIGSEGTLALITKATLKLVPLPEAKRTLRVTYEDMRAAATAVSAVMAQSVTPCALEHLSRETGIRIVNFGHAGNGNIHVNLLVNPDDPDEMARADRCLDALFTLVIGLGGTISGEHGVGITKRDYVEREIDPATLCLMWDIKRQFDPNGILNPGKSLPER